ncbi:DUF2987 domain-containing protein [uncultured Paraglaciecola sp.]|mgnify:CR=1 FL=1|uniref:DUF2987 domain-containing protein n=1 Tax=uncultured Paraglaciecola sp. TaxID=1765024 RepID=UPI0030DC4BA6
MKIILLILAPLLLSTQAHADTLEVEYSSFYSHVKKLDDPSTDALRFAFGFQHVVQSRLCHISSAQIITQKQTLPLSVENNNRFTVPTDKILKMAKARVVVELEDQANQCDMSVQLETKPSFLQTEYSHKELLVLFNQYQAFFDEMGGFLSFMMPSAKGLLFHFNGEVQLPNKLQVLTDKNGVLILNNQWLSQQKDLKLPSKPLRITAMIDN